MSGRSSTGSNPFTQPDADIDIPDGLTGANPQLSEILRQILNRVIQVETEFRGTQSREGDLTNNMANLQRAQTTVQQSLNLLQAAHNALHETMGGGPIPTSGGSKSRRIWDGCMLYFSAVGQIFFTIVNAFSTISSFSFCL